MPHEQLIVRKTIIRQFTMQHQTTRARIIDGKAVAASIRDEVRAAVARMAPHHRPRFAVVQVGERSDSSVYIRMKQRAAAETGIDCAHHLFPESITQRRVRINHSRLQVLSSNTYNNKNTLATLATLATLTRFLITYFVTQSSSLISS
jgi:Tetrahydrofolate dehydrogenase/cyclohydrolase, catalytic domain